MSVRMTAPRPNGYRDELAAALLRIEELEAELRGRRKIFDADAEVVAIERRRRELSDAPRLYRLAATRGPLVVIPVILLLARVFGPGGTIDRGGRIPTWLAMGGLASMQILVASSVILMVLWLRRRAWSQQMARLDNQVNEARERSLEQARARENPGSSLRVATSAESDRATATDAADLDDELLAAESSVAASERRATRSGP